MTVTFIWPTILNRTDIIKDGPDNLIQNVFIPGLVRTVKNKDSVGVIQECNLVFLQHIICIENNEVSPLKVYPTHCTLS